MTINGLPLWIIALICVGVFLASFMDAIAGGGGIISVPTYLLALHGMPTYFVLGTNKLSAGIGTVFSTARFIKRGYVKWSLAAPSVLLALLGSVLGTWLQHLLAKINRSLKGPITCPRRVSASPHPYTGEESIQPIPASIAATKTSCACVMGSSPQSAPPPKAHVPKAKRGVFLEAI